MTSVPVAEATSRRPLVIDLFAGVGGMSLGFEQAGFDVVAAVEIDPIHAAAHAYNFPQCAVIPRSIIDLSGRDIRKAAGIGDRPIDVVIGGPPCQGFSLIGRRLLEDPRNGLVREYLRIVRELEPDFFLFENVKGITLGSHKDTLTDLIQAFHAIGYRLVSPWQVLNAAHYGVPQDRQRLFLLGARKHLLLPDYPDPQNDIPGHGYRRTGRPLGPSCQDALGDLPNADDFEALKRTDSVSVAHWKEPSVYARSLRCAHESSWHFGYSRNWDPLLLTSSLRTIHTEVSIERFRNTLPGHTEPVSRFYKLSAVGVSNTLRAGTDSSRGAFSSPRPIHYEFNRCVSVREMARLHGFPDWFRFHKTKWHGARQIGNAVPPPMARALASKLLVAMEITPSQPIGEKLRLGHEDLLAMNMSRAADYFGVRRFVNTRAPSHVDKTSPGSKTGALVEQ